MTDEARANASEAHRGQAPWNKGGTWTDGQREKLTGLSRTDETRERIRAARATQEITPKHRAAISAALTGKSKSAEHIAKLSGPRHYRWTGSPARNLSKREWRAVREAVLERDGYACVQCGNDNRRSLVVHHRIEHDRGGPDESWNLVTACRSCHVRHDSLMKSSGAGLSLLSPPLQQSSR